jgi:hypothetical protein
MSGWLLPAAHISAVWPRNFSIAFTSAPRSISTFAMSCSPVLIASISAVWLSVLGEFRSAPASSRVRNSVSSPSRIASVSAVAPYLLLALAFAPAFSKAFTSSWSALKVAHISEVEPSGAFTFTSTSGEVIAASTESRLPSRTRSTSVRCGAPSAE